MKLLSNEILARKKTILIFVNAILIPLLVLSYLGYDTFTERQESTKKLLESNLWISGQAALSLFEEQLLELEKQILTSENFRLIINKESSFSNEFQKFKRFGRLFLLDVNYNMIFPKTGIGEELEFSSQIRFSNKDFVVNFTKAESFEFSKRNYSKAVQHYNRSKSFAQTKQEQSLALEGIARSYLAAGNYRMAEETYISLIKDYSQINNKAGHPYGVIASLQLFEISKKLKKESDGIKSLLQVYEKMKKGEWSLNLSSYKFFISEIESILKDGYDLINSIEMRDQYDLIKKVKAPYLDDLIFAEYLTESVIPKIKETILISGSVFTNESKRFLSNSEEKNTIVSFKGLIQFINKKKYYAGLCWDSEYTENEIIPKLIKSVSDETGLDYLLIDEENHNILSNQIIGYPENSISLSFRQFPFPWKFIAIQPAFKDLEEDTQKEILFYGFVLIIIIVLMFLGAVLIARDITRESESMKVKTEFVHNVSHELKTPLSLIRLYGETLFIKENLSQEDKKDALQVITKESERLSHMINNILDFSKIEMGRKEFEFKKGNFANVIRNTLESYRYHLEKKGFCIKKEISPDIPLITFDSEAIEGVLINLLSNAIKFSPDEKEVIIKLFFKNGNIILQVADKGIGIEQKEIKNIFERFYKSKQAPGFEARGSGLGLTLVKHVVDAHGGKINVDSNVGEGTTFTILIPVSGSNGENLS